MPAHDRADLEQQAIIQLWQAVAAPGFEAEGFWGLVEVVVARRCIDWLRARQPEQSPEDWEGFPDRRASPLVETLDAERRDLARAAVERLPQICQTILRLRFASGKSYREISEILGTTEGALRVKVHRCISSARRVMRDLERFASEKVQKSL